jgi:hypothetical protein
MEGLVCITDRVSCCGRADRSGENSLVEEQ